MKSNPYFIDQQGNILTYDDINSHIGIATRYIESDPRIKEEYEKSGIKYPSDFLVMKKGFIQVTDDTGNGFYNRKIMFSAVLAKPIQKRIIMGYIEDGFEAENLDKFHRDSIVKRFHDFDEPEI